MGDARRKSMSTIDHLTLVVSNYERSKAFYEKVLSTLGIRPVMDFGQACGFGRENKPDFWIGAGASSFHKPEHLHTITPTHVAFAARNRAEVQAFHKAALEAGAKDFGAPGVRVHYHPNYYGAFVLDPDGHDIEAVFHGEP
jgi:catechol 2,3-dioxygenase-like lactoylglutathione lyase family enzyme